MSMNYGRTWRLVSQQEFSRFTCCTCKCINMCFQDKLSSEETEDEEDDVLRESEDVVFAQDYLHRVRTGTQLTVQRDSYPFSFSHQITNLICCSLLVEFNRPTQSGA
ncbi:hypothetical protein XENOCAPTIV_025976 [Xenoophorus captivus]|uniref:Uncharacterized protein n=1 Tax=Xenoophorus captivus TaxID=1517983 RepID=A0ABV0S9C6_9TELE